MHLNQIDDSILVGLSDYQISVIRNCLTKEFIQNAKNKHRKTIKIQYLERLKNKKVRKIREITNEIYYINCKQIDLLDIINILNDTEQIQNNYKLALKKLKE